MLPFPGVARPRSCPGGQGSLLAGRLAPGGDGDKRGRRGGQANAGRRSRWKPSAMWVAHRQVRSMRRPEWSGGADELGGDVQDSVAEGGDLGTSERGQVRRSRSVWSSRSGRPRPARPPARRCSRPRPGKGSCAGRCLGLANAIFDAGVLAVPQLQAGYLAGDATAGGVGEERGDAVASTSVNVSCAPGCGRSLRRISRDPSGQDDRSIMPVASATHAPSRSPSSSSIAGCQH